MKRIKLAVILLALLLALTACSTKAGVEEAEASKETNDIGENGATDSINGSTDDTDGKDNNSAVKDATDLKANEDTDQGTGTASANSAEREMEDVKLTELSQELALQMVNGEFEQTHQLLAPLVKLQLPLKSLEAAWESTVDGMGSYRNIYSVEEEAQETYRNVYVVLKYDKYGLKLTLSYNDKGKIEGLWLTYSIAGMDLETTDKYSEQAIRIGEGDYPVDGILTIPNGVDKPPVIILVHGSGTHDWDETVGAGVNKPFRDIAWGLAEQGIATIRYQERAAIYPELASEKVTIDLDSLDDVNAAIAFAADCNQVDTGRIYILGHSLGGMLAPKIAADHKEVKGIICLAGSPRKLEDIAADQQELLLGASYKNQIAEARKQAEEIKKLTEESEGDYLGMPASYWYSLNQIDTPSIVKTLKLPMLIAQGSADWQVYADKDYTAWQELLGDRKNVTFKLYDDLNHMFMPTNGKLDVTEYLVPSSVDQQVIDDIASWVREN